MSEEPEVGEENPLKPAEIVAEEDLDEVAGGGAGAGTGKVPIKDDASFISFPPQFIKVMSFREAGATGSGATKSSVLDLFDRVANDSNA